MSQSRRTFLKILGGGVIVAAAGAGGFLATRTPEAALAPWQAAGSYTDPVRRALSYAILAPNPHNRQPWVADLAVKNEVTLYRDKARNLPHTDPFDRQMTIGMGCFIELFSIAASQTGHSVSARLFPAGEDGPVAVLTLTDGATADPLFAHVLDRRSCKEPFEARAVPPALQAELAGLATIIDAPERVAAIRDLTWRAWMIEMQTPRTLKESVDLMRFGKAEINANPDGIDLGGPFLESLMVAGLLSREAQADPTSSGFQQGVDIYRDMLAATPAYAVVTTATNTREDQIAAGRQWLRLNLTTTGLGLSLHPVSQALQEFPEMAALHSEAHEMLAPDGQTVQMLGRLGFGPKTPPSPRWPIETRLRHG